MSNDIFWSIFLVAWLAVGLIVALIFGRLARHNEDGNDRHERDVFMRDMKNRCN
jgi:hypothetical protein